MAQIFELKMHIGGYDDDSLDYSTIGMFSTRELAEAHIVELALKGETIRSAEIIEHSLDA